MGNSRERTISCFRPFDIPLPRGTNKLDPVRCRRPFFPRSFFLFVPQLKLRENKTTDNRLLRHAPLIYFQLILLFLRFCTPIPKLFNSIDVSANTRTPISATNVLAIVTLFEFPGCAAPTPENELHERKV